MTLTLLLRNKQEVCLPGNNVDIKELNITAESMNQTAVTPHFIFNIDNYLIIDQIVDDIFIIFNVNWTEFYCI